MCILIHVFPSCLLLLVQVFDVYVFTLTLVDVVGGLHVTISRHLFVLVYLCNKLIIVVAIAFVYCS